MKIVILILLTLTLANSKTFEQAFNIQSIKPKMQVQKISKTYYATTTYNERKIYEVSIRFDGYIENLEANELYKSVKKGDKLFDIYSKHIHALKKELLATNNFQALQKNDHPPYALMSGTGRTIGSVRPRSDYSSDRGV